MAGRAGSQVISPESAGAKDSARDLGIMDTGTVEQTAVLTQLEQESLRMLKELGKLKALRGLRVLCARR